MAHYTLTKETPNEELAAEELQTIVDDALDEHDRKAITYLRKLWDGESWKSIKAKLETEGSAWHVWWMDGVRQHLANLTAGLPPVI